MDKSYLNSIKNNALSLKPSKAIRLFLMVLFGNAVFGQSVGDYKSNGNVTFTSSTNWQIWNGSSWGTATQAPTAVTSNNVIAVSSSNTVSVSGTVVLSASLAVSGTVSLVDGTVFTVGTNSNWSNVTINSGGSFNMPNNPGSASATLVLHGNYYNNGATDFWKSVVVITGDLLSPSTSALQNQGNVIVGGNIIGDFNLSGSGSNQIYPINPNAVVTITPTSIDNYVNPGTFPSSESSTLIDLVSSVILGNSICSFTVTDPPSNISACVDGNISTTITTIVGSPSYQWQINSGSGWSDLAGQTSATLSLANVALGMSGNKYRVKVTSSSCTKNGNYVTLTVNPLPTAPIVNITQPTCANQTATITIAAVTGQTYSFDNGTFSTTLVYSNLAQGSSHTVSTKNAEGCISQVTNITINSLTNKWVTSWSNGTPTVEQNLEFAGNYSSSSDVSGCSCQVTAGAVVIKSGYVLKITNALTVSGGSLTFEDKSSLVQINNVVNSGDIIYKRTTSSVLASDYTYWSSPVANQNLSISPSYASGMFYSYNDFAVPEDWKSETATSVMLAGKGYAIRGPQIAGTPVPPGFYYATFKGVPNNGTKNIAIGPTGTSSLLGNPYPSAINADLFLAANRTLVEGTIYFWTHKTAIQLASNIASGKAGSGVLAYTSDDYASYNGTGGVAVIGGDIPNGKIAAGQAFFTTSLGAGTVTFNNAMRLSSGGAILDNSQFFKTKKTNGKTANAIEKNRVWLNLANSEGVFKQTLVGYITDATNEYDSRFDGESFDGNEFVDFYSINHNKNLVIQGRALPFDENDEVPLGYRTAIKGAFTISIDQVDGALADQAVFVEDKLTNTVFNLKNGNYTFETKAGIYDDRFVLKYSNKTLATPDLDTVVNQVVVSVKNKQVKINSFAETIDKVEVYDLSGRQIYKKDKVNDSELLITNFNSNHQALVVKTILQNGKMVTDKIIY